MDKTLFKYNDTNFWRVMRGEVVFGVCAFFILLTFIACNREESPDCFQSAGEIITITRPLDNFNAVELRDYIQYELYDSTAFFVEITAPKNLIPEVNTEISNGLLVIENHNSCNFVRSYKKKIIVRIYAPDFRSIQNYSTGNVNSINTITSSSFKIENRNAAGKIDLDLHVDSATIATHTGVCDVIARGESTVTTLFNQGVGYIDARALNSIDAFVNNSSINDVFVNTNGYLFALVVFSGNIYYTGTPNHIDSDIKGNGAVQPL